MANSKLFTDFLRSIARDITTKKIQRVEEVEDAVVRFLKNNPKLSASDVGTGFNKVFHTSIKIPTKTSKSGQKILEINNQPKFERELSILGLHALFGILTHFNCSLPEMNEIMPRIKAEIAAEQARLEQQAAQAQRRRAVLEAELRKEEARMADLPRQVFNEFHGSDRYQEVVGELGPRWKEDGLDIEKILQKASRSINADPSVTPVPTQRYTDARPTAGGNSFLQNPEFSPLEHFGRPPMPPQSVDARPAQYVGSAGHLSSGSQRVGTNPSSFTQQIARGATRLTSTQPPAAYAAPAQQTTAASRGNPYQLYSQRPCAQQSAQRPTAPTTTELEYKADGLLNWDSVSYY